MERILDNRLYYHVEQRDIQLSAGWLSKKAILKKQILKIVQAITDGFQFDRHHGSKPFHKQDIWYCLEAKATYITLAKDYVKFRYGIHETSYMQQSEIMK